MDDIAPWNWPMHWRVLVLLNISVYNMMGNIFTAGVTPLFGLLVLEFQITVNQASYLSSYALLAFGLANIWALPATAYIGKRWTILISMSIFLAASIFASQANSYDSLVASRIIGGLFGGIIEALGPLIVSELFPEHQLASAMVVYVSFLAAGSAIGPVIAGLIGTHLNSWRWFFGVCSIAIGMNFITSVIMLPETSFAEEWAPTMPDAQNTEKGPPSDDIEIVESVLATTPAISPPVSGTDLWTLWHHRSFFLPWNFSKVSPPKQRFSGMVTLLLEPWSLLLTPQVFVTTLIFGLTIGWTVVISILFSTVLQMPPHLWSAQSIGLINFSALIGIVIGLPVGGPFADKLSAVQTKRSGGEHNPCSRLPALLLGGTISPAGLLVIGFSFRPEHFSWIGAAAGWAMLSFGLTAASNVLLAYSVDCFRHKAGHVGVLVNVIKNSIGFGVSYASVEWYTNSGPVLQMGTMAGILWFAYLLALPLYFLHENVMKLSCKIVR